MSVVIVSAETGRTAIAKPAASEVTTKSRRVKSRFGVRLVRWVGMATVLAKVRSEERPHGEAERLRTA